MNRDPRDELSVLEEKFRALQTLVRYERDIQKLQIYRRELDLVIAELQKIDAAREKRPSAKIIPFTPKKPLRSA